MQAERSQNMKVASVVFVPEMYRHFSESRSVLDALSILNLIEKDLAVRQLHLFDLLHNDVF